MHRVRSSLGSSRKLWVALTALGALFGAGSLAYPLVLDGAVNQYVAREWLFHGALPYRDTFDHRAPGIYVIHMLCLQLFGLAPYGIRIAEILAMVGCASLAAAAITPSHEKVKTGTMSAAFLGGCVLYFGFFDYWCTAQCEIWLSLAALGALAAASRVRTLRRAAAVTGLCFGVAALLKPPGVLLILPALILLHTRARGMRTSVGVTFVLCAAALPTSVLTYFAARGGLSALLDVLVGANAHYVSSEPQEAHPLVELGKAWRFFSPVGALLVCVMAFITARSFLRADGRSRAWLAPSTLGLAVLVVVVQRKYFLYHWGVLLVPVTLLVASVARVVLSGRRATLGMAAAVATLLVFYGCTGWPCEHWLRSTEVSALWETGRMDQETYDGSFVGFPRFYGHRFDYPEREIVAQWLKSHSKPDDELLVRGMAAEIYLLTNLRAPSRFFWSLFLSEPTRAYHRNEWLREDADAIALTPPRWVVTYGDSASEVESAAHFEALGYRRRVEVGELVVLERATYPIATGPRFD